MELNNQTFYNLFLELVQELEKKSKNKNLYWFTIIAGRMLLNKNSEII